MTTSIRRPGVNIAQELVTSNPTVSAPPQSAVIIGPCFRVISAFDDDGEPQDDAYAGTYQDGYGTVSYDLPSLGSEDSLTGLSSHVRVFLVLGDDSTELNAVSDEETITSGTTSGTYDQSAATFTDAGQTFVQLGVELGDVVRVSWRGDTIDIPITVDPASDTVLTVDDTLIPEDITSTSYTIIRNPAQFVFDSASQADYTFGDLDDYLTLTVVVDSAYDGSLGDDLTLVIEEKVYVSSDDAAVGDSIFTASDATFVTDIGATGAPSTAHYVVIGATGAAAVLREIVYVATETVAFIETGEGALGTQNWIYGSEAATGSNGATGAGDETAFTSAGALFDTTIPSGAVPAAPTTTTYIEIEGVGVFQVTSVNSNTSLTISAGAGTGLSGKNYTVITQVDTGTGTGSTAADTKLFFPNGGLDDVPGVATDYSVDIGGVIYAIVSFDSDYLLTAASMAAAEGTDVSAAVAAENEDLALSWNGDTETITLTLARVSTVSTNTFAEVEDAITNDLNASYNANVSAIITAALGGVTGDGSTTLTSADVGSYAFDGGADDDQLILDADLIGSTTPVGKIYVSYKALRLDVSAAAATPVLGEYENTTDAQDQLGAATTDNPLSLGVYFALLNAPSRTVKGLGVSEVSATKPMGTLDAYTEALDFLEGQPVYSLVPLTQDPTVHQAFKTHVDSMSEAENRAERVLLFSQAFPSYSVAETLASGTTGNTGTFDGQASAEFATGVNLTAAGVQDAIDGGDTVYLVVSALSTVDDSPDSVPGSQGLYGLEVTEVKTTDDFVLVLDASGAGVSANWDNLVDVNWTVFSGGTAITAKSAQRDAVAAISENFADRRCFHVWPPQVIADVDGTSSVLDGYYLAAAVGGWISQKNPSQGLTNGTVAGFTGLRYSNNYFMESQLDLIAGGGTMIFVQDAPNGALKCRHQLSTDTSSIQYRELSITTAVDYTAWIFRQALTNQIGIFNITQSFLDSLAVKVQGLGRYLVATHVLNDFDTLSIGVNADDPTEVDIVAGLDVMYPCNTIYMRLQI